MAKAHAIFFNPPLENHWLGHQFEEIYKTKLYEPYLRGKKDLTIIDAGGNVGLTSYYFSQFAKDVYTLEPFPEMFELIKQMIEYNEIDKIVHPIQKALYIENGKFGFGGPESNKTMQSLHSAVWTNGKPDLEVEAIDLVTLFKENNIEHVDLLKMDIEGSEYEVFGHSSFSDVADKIDMIIGESHQWANRHPNQLKDALENRGFEFQWMPHDAQLFVAQKKK